MTIKMFLLKKQMTICFTALFVLGRKFAFNARVYGFIFNLIHLAQNEKCDMFCSATAESK